MVKPVKTSEGWQSSDGKFKGPRSEVVRYCLSPEPPQSKSETTSGTDLSGGVISKATAHETGYGETHSATTAGAGTGAWEVGNEQADEGHKQDDTLLEGRQEEETGQQGEGEHHEDDGDGEDHSEGDDGDGEDTGEPEAEAPAEGKRRKRRRKKRE